MSRFFTNPTINFDTMRSDNSRLVRFEIPYASHIFPSTEASIAGISPTPILSNNLELGTMKPRIIIEDL